MFHYRADIDGLRAVAILPVVAYHAGMPGVSGGFIGVDVFFVISAFLITSIIHGEMQRGSFSLVKFYERRARRILPALTAMIVACFAAGLLVLLPSELEALGKSAIATTVFAANIHFAVTLDYFAQAAEFATLLHAWSLAVEEQFYLIFPLLLLALHGRTSRRTTLLALAALSLVSLAAAAWMLPRDPGRTFYLLPFRAWELGVGALLALLPASRSLPRRGNEALAAAGLAAILVPVTLYDHTTGFPGLAALPPVLGTAAILHAGRSGPSFVAAALSTRPMVAVGLISYSLYLWHWPILSLMRSARVSTDLPPVLAVAGVALSFALATLSYAYVERPFRRRPPHGPGRATVFKLSAVSLALTAGLGLVFTLNDGAPGRLPPQTLAIAAAAADTNPRRGSCFERLPADGLCTLGAPSDSGDADFLLWGDSHALAIMPAIDEAARAAGLSGRFAGSSACLPVPTLRREPEWRDCTKLNAAMETYLSARTDMPLVLLAGRWTLSLTGSRFREESGANVLLVNSTQTPDVSPDQLKNPEILRAALSEATAMLTTSGRTVLLLGPVPEAGWDVPLRLARSQLPLGRPAPAPVTRAEHAARSDTTEALLSALAAANRGVTYVTLSPYFCGEICAFTGDDGLPLYSDDDHLTTAAARARLTAPLTEALRDGRR